MLELVDAQVHFNDFASLETGITAMEAVGVRALVLDEVTRGNLEYHGRVLPNGAVRVSHEFSATAWIRYPDRFVYTQHIDPRDPEAGDLVAAAALDRPRQAGVRITPHIHLNGVARFEAGEWDGIIAACAKERYPVFCLLSGWGGNVGMLERVARKFPDAPLVLDHTGIPLGPGGASEDGVRSLLALAKYPNVFVKWCGAPRLAPPGEGFPFPTAVGILVRAVEAFGPQRLLWGSDHTRTRRFHSWADSFGHILATSELSQGDKEWILGRSLRTLLRWPAPAAR